MYSIEESTCDFATLGFLGPRWVGTMGIVPPISRTRLLFYERDVAVSISNLFLFYELQRSRMDRNKYIIQKCL